jgi:hypothetical protein
MGSGGSGVFYWSIPVTQTPGSDYTVKVTSTKNALYSDRSNGNFSITAPPRPSIKVSTPNGGESWQAGTSQTIQWTFTGNPGSDVKIQLLRQRVVARTISTSAPMGDSGSGCFIWSIPSGLAAGNQYKIRVVSTSKTAYRDESDAVFTIFK